VAFSFSSERETPRRKAVASERFLRRFVFVAASVRLHGARPWHLERVAREVFCSGERETPRRKAVASQEVSGFFV